MTADPLAAYTYPPGYCDTFLALLAQIYAYAHGGPQPDGTMKAHVAACEKCGEQEARELPKIGGEG